MCDLLAEIWDWLPWLQAHESYELCDGAIIRHHGPFTRNRLSIKQIAAWQIHPEMCFDCVTFKLTDGSEIIWFDYYDDLLSIVRVSLPDREDALSITP